MQKDKIYLFTDQNTSCEKKREILRVTPKFLAKVSGKTEPPSIEMIKNEEKQGVRTKKFCTGRSKFKKQQITYKRNLENMAAGKAAEEKYLKENKSVKC